MMLPLGSIFSSAPLPRVLHFYNAVHRRRVSIPVLAIVIAPERATGRAESRNGLLLYAEMEYQ